MSINVVKAISPDAQSFQKNVQNILETGHFSNGGPYLKELEASLLAYLNLQNIITCTNGTLALQLAIRALKLNGKKVITTPFSYVATTSALLWEGCEPVFVDIDPQTLCIEPHMVEKHITPEIAAILPVHVFGNACDVEGFEEISKKYNIPILYDAAHAFGSTYLGRSLFAYGDCSIASFHATKLFHTCEGGAIFFQEKALSNTARLLSQFGHIKDTHYTLGINAKLSELHAAMGISILPCVNKEIDLRKEICAQYNNLLQGLPIKKITLRHGLEYNYSYYPVIFENESILDAVKIALENASIFPRRYFYPSLNTLPYLQEKHKYSCPVSESVANSILCLPLYGSLTTDNIQNIVNIIKNTIN